MIQLSRTLRHVASAVLPIAVLVMLLDITVAKSEPLILPAFAGGLAFVVTGLTLFLFAVDTCLLEVGHSIGGALPRLGTLWRVLLVGGVIGLTVTVAEPDVRVLAHQVDIVSGGRISHFTLVMAIGIGVGVSLALALLRVVLRVPLKRVYVLGYLLVLGLAFVTPGEYLPVSFDAGGVTTGPVTVPFILALGVGMASVLSGRSASADGFGYVGLASIGPIIAVLLLAIAVG